MNDLLTEKLNNFRNERRVKTKGSLALVLHVSRTARETGLPLDTATLRTPQQGQVKGLSKASVQMVLKDYGLTRTLAQEGGRTSRGSLGLMENYVAFLNELNMMRLDDLEAIEAWWVERVRDYFASQPFILRYDPGKSIQALIGDLLEQVKKRQVEDLGATYVGSVLQHLVGAKLELVIPDVELAHHGASVADKQTEREGDFVIDRVAIHVTTAPSGALMEKCRKNLDSGYVPVIVTLAERVSTAMGNAEMTGIVERVEIFAAEQFLAANLHELSGFRIENRHTSFNQLIERYNAIVDECETDPGLKIQLGG